MTNLTPDDLAAAATEALTRPSDSAWWDDRLFTTHGCVFTWADQTDDAVSESNYRVFLTCVEALVDPESDDVIASGARHWAVGSVEHIFVRVYGEDGDYTPAFIAATEMAHEMRDYPILDESDWSEVEHEHEERDVRDWIPMDVAHEARRIIRDEAIEPNLAEALVDDLGLLDSESIQAAYWEAVSDGTVTRWSSDEYQGLTCLARSLVADYLDSTPEDPDPTPSLLWDCVGQLSLVEV